jgi:hypothetical protein
MTGFIGTAASKAASPSSPGSAAIFQSTDDSSRLLFCRDLGGNIEVEDVDLPWLVQVVEHRYPLLTRSRPNKSMSRSSLAMSLVFTRGWDPGHVSS